jgi:hypothetical protein
MSSLFHIYHLIDPITHQVRYVGRCTDTKARLRNHCNEAARRQTTEKHRWINALLAAGRVPVLLVVGVYADAVQSRQCESNEFHRHKATLFNVHDPLRFPAVIAKKGKK